MKKFVENLVGVIFHLVGVIFLIFIVIISGLLISSFHADERITKTQPIIESVLIINNQPIPFIYEGVAQDTIKFESNPANFDGAEIIINPNQEFKIECYIHSVIINK